MMAYGAGFGGCGIFPLLLGIAIIGFLFYILSKRGNPSKEPQNFNSNSQAIEQLNYRLANGEITIEEYQALKNTLLK